MTSAQRELAAFLAEVNDFARRLARKAVAFAGLAHFTAIGVCRFEAGR